MPDEIRLAILDDHPSIIDGYRYRLATESRIKIVATGLNWEEFEPKLASNPADVLILDLCVPTSADNHATIPVQHVVPALIKQYPGMHILVISMFQQPALVEELANAGVSGYIVKQDSLSLQQLVNVIGIIAGGGFYFSPGAFHILHTGRSRRSGLSPRQLEALSMCAAYPNSTSKDIANMLGTSAPTVRNLLSMAYRRLSVTNRAAAIERARELSLLPQEPINPQPP